MKHMAGEKPVFVPPAAPQPDIVEARLRVKEYWYETFRRVLLIPSSDDRCLLLSIDVYAKLEKLPPNFRLRASFQLAGDRVRVHYLDIPVDMLGEASLGNVKPKTAELLVVEAVKDGRLEAVNVRVTYCDLNVTPSRDEVWQVYRSVVRLVEGRDPEREPLKAPEPVARVYASRLGGQ